MLRLLLPIFIAFSFLGIGAINAAPMHNKTVKKEAKQVANKIDINSADVNALAALNGIGPKKAQAIIDYRNKHGKFTSVNDLTKVKGIGDKFLAKIEKKNPNVLVVK